MERFGDYVLYEPLGTGDHCPVHRAALTASGAPVRAVAIKRFPDNRFPSRAAADQYADEIARAAELDHPNIVAIHRVGRLGDTTFVEMEHVVGCSLEELLHEIRTDGPPPIEVVVSLLVELAGAIGFAHQQGVVHGDLHPCHLMVDWTGHLRVLGFGMSRLEQRPASSCYAAPETLQGGPPGVPADLYSLGVIGYELVTGRPLFDEHLNPDLRRYLASCISPPSTCNPNCPPEMDELLLGALAADPDERWASAEELASALAPLGAAAPTRVRDWLAAAAPHTRPPASGAIAPLPRGVLPEPPRRVARGTSRLPSPNRIASRPERAAGLAAPAPIPPPPRALRALDRLLHEAETVIQDRDEDEDETVIQDRDEDEDETVIHDDARALHEADTVIVDGETVIRDTPPRRNLRLPLAAPSEPYAALELSAPAAEADRPAPTVEADRPAPTVQTPQAPAGAPPVEVPPLPLFVASSWHEPEQTLRPIHEPRRLARSVELGLAFAAGAVAMYLALAWLG